MLDVKHPEAAKLLERLVLEKADVVVQNLAPGAPPPPRTGAAHATIYPYGPLPTGDGGQVMLGLQYEREWLNFCDKVLLQPALAQDPRFAGNAQRVAAHAALRALIVEAFAGMTAPQVVARLEAAHIASTRVNTMAGVWAHPQLKARHGWPEVGSPVGMLPAMLPPGSWGPGPDNGPRMDPVPALCKHTDAPRVDLGLSPEQVRALRAAVLIRSMQTPMQTPVPAPMPKPISNPNAQSQRT